MGWADIGWRENYARVGIVEFSYCLDIQMEIHQVVGYVNLELKGGNLGLKYEFGGKKAYK